MRRPTGQGRSRTIEINTGHEIRSVLFTEDGKQVLSGGAEGMLRQWRVGDGHEVGEPIRTEGAEVFAAALSSDHRRLVCGLRRTDASEGRANAGVWDAQTHEKVLDIYGHTSTVFSVDISLDSTKFATGSADNLAFIWSMTAGERLVGPLQHDGWVVAVRFSPDGDRIATATAENPDAKSIRIYDSENGQQLLDIPFPVNPCTSSSLAWVANGRQLLAASYNNEVHSFDASSGTLLSKWSVPGGGWSASIILSQNQKFMAVVTLKSLSFWDTFTHTQIGTIIEPASHIWSVALSPKDDCIAAGEKNGKITFRSLRDILPRPYFTVTSTPVLSPHPTPSQLPFMYISDAALKSWMQGDLTHAEELLTQDTIRPSNAFHHACALAQRALVRTRLKQWDMAIDDSTKSIEIRRSTIGYIAHAVAHLGSGEHELALRVFDLVFSDSVQDENKLLLLIRAIILFECGKHNEAIIRVGDLIDIVNEQSSFISVRAHMYLLLGSMLMRTDSERAIELCKRAQEAIPFRQSPYLVFVSLIFGWDFDGLATAIRSQIYKAMGTADQTEVVEDSVPITVEVPSEEASGSDVTADWDPDLVQTCLTAFESKGDVAVRSKDFKRAILQYSTALSLNPSNPASLFVKRSNARAMSGLWEDALKDADDAIKVDPLSPWGYERKHAALHALQRYDEAIVAFNRMHSLIEGSPDQDIRQLGKKYVSPIRLEAAINNIVHASFKICPLVLIDVKTGRLCDRPERMHLFRSESQWKELISSMTEELDEGRVHRVVMEYFRYVMLSHVWEGKEPSFQGVNSATSVWDLDSSPQNDKLRNFCEAVRSDGYRWAWSDTCCIDKTISAVLNQSITMMYKWYEASAATFVHLASVASPSAFGDLTHSIWMTRAWTELELLAPRVIRFYDRDWKPYLGDIRSNHKDSPEIMQEVADAVGIAHDTIVSFNPDDLSTREKLRLASTRNATLKEDVAYSLIGILKSDIRPDYGEGDAALGRLLEDIVARSGDVTVLSWTGKSSSYNSCLPATLAVYSYWPAASPAIDDTEMDARIAELRNSVSQTDVMIIHERVTCLPPARFAERRLHLPCIIFPVKRLGVQDSRICPENLYRARVSGIGTVEFQTSDRLSLTEPRKLIFVHPWICDLCDPVEGFTWGSTADDEEYESDLEIDARSASSSPLRAAAMDDHTRALRLVVRLQQPFHALLLQQQPNGEFKRVASEHEIIMPGIDRRINFARDVRTGVVEIL